MAGRIFDCLCFPIDCDADETRLRALARHGDRLVPVASALDFAGRPTRPYIANHRRCLAVFDGQIIPAVLAKPSTSADSGWATHGDQCDQVGHGGGNASPSELTSTSGLDKTARVSKLPAVGEALMEQFANDMDPRRPDQPFTSLGGTRASASRRPRPAGQFRRRDWKAHPVRLDRTRLYGEAA